MQGVVDKPIFGIRSPNGNRYLECNPFEEGLTIALAKDEELFCYLNASDLARTTKARDERGSLRWFNLWAITVTLALSAIILLEIFQ